MMNDWEARVKAFWKSADVGKPDATFAEMKRLVEELAEADPNGLFELASVHDFLGLAQSAVPLYEQSLRAGLAGLKREKAVIQLASSLRNLGRAAEAMDLLEQTAFGAETSLAAKAFLALAQLDSDSPRKALATALLNFYPEDGLYARSIRTYAQELARKG